MAREGGEFGVLRRAVAVGGQVVTIQGLGAVYEDVFLPLHGAHQAQNAAVALAAVEAFFGAGGGTDGRQLDVETVRAGLASASSPGRLERVRNAPTILLDGAHNPHGMAATAVALQEEFAFRRLVAVVAVLADKDAAGLLEQLEPVAEEVVVTRSTSPRAMPVDTLAAVAEEVFGAGRVSVEPDLPDAIERRSRWPSLTWTAHRAGWASSSPVRCSPSPTPGSCSSDDRGAAIGRSSARRAAPPLGERDAMPVGVAEGGRPQLQPRAPVDRARAMGEPDSLGLELLVDRLDVADLEVEVDDPPVTGSASYTVRSTRRVSPEASTALPEPPSIS